MDLRIIASAIAITFVLTTAAAQAEIIYSWTDENGIRHLTNVPPVEPGENMDVFEVKPPQIVGLPGIQYAKPDEQLRNQLETDVSIIGNHVIVPVTLSYKKKKIDVRLLLDTGATNITLHRSIAEKLSVNNSQKGSVRVAGGALIDAEAIVLDSVTLGPHTIKNLMAGIIDHKGPDVDFDGLLGMNFLKNLRYTIDFENQVLRWNR